jgi:nucleoside phosphorylase
MADSATAISGVLDKAESSLTRLERVASASWPAKQWSLRAATAVRRDLRDLETQLGGLPTAWQPGGNPRQVISFKAAREKVERSSRDVRATLDNLRDDGLPAEGRSGEFAAYAKSSENLRDAIGQFRETLLTLDEGALAEAMAAERAEPDYELEDQPWYAASPPEFRETGREEAEALQASIDVVLITVTDVELRAVLKPLQPLERQDKVLSVAWGTETYYLGQFGEYPVAVTMCEMGSMDSGSVIAATIQAQQVWLPRAVIMIGIAFGRDRTKQRIADVIVASKVISYEPERRGQIDVPRGPISPANPLLLNRLRNALGWQFERPDQSRCKMIVDTVLSGEKLVDNAEYKRELFARYPQAVGGEMEGAGLGAAANRTSTAWILVKGICDWGDGRKDSRHQPLAAAAATSLVLHIMSQRTALRDLVKPAPPAS